MVERGRHPSSEEQDWRTRTSADTLFWILGYKGRWNRKWGHLPVFMNLKISGVGMPNTGITIMITVQSVLYLIGGTPGVAPSPFSLDLGFDIESLETEERGVTPGS